MLYSAFLRFNVKGREFLLLALNEKKKCFWTPSKKKYKKWENEKSAQLQIYRMNETNGFEITSRRIKNVSKKDVNVEKNSNKRKWPCPKMDDILHHIIITTTKIYAHSLFQFNVFFLIKNKLFNWKYLLKLIKFLLLYL